MTDERSNELDKPERDELPRPVVKRRRRFSASLIWLVPALAAVIGISLIINSVLQAGPEITITFQTAEGLDAGKTPVKYKNVVIGKVDKISLSEDRSHVKVSVALEKSAKSFATQGTRVSASVASPASIRCCPVPSSVPTSAIRKLRKRTSRGWKRRRR
jgi:paraquat-inducible protein B